MEVDSRALPVSPDNPYGLAVVTEATPVRSEAESARDFNWETQRSWKVVNPNKTNRVGHQPGVQAGAERLVPGADGSAARRSTCARR